MTTAADDTAAEAAFEAFLAGRPAPEEAADSFHAVAAFAGAVRATATLPGRPNAALAELLATGLLTDQSSPSARTATSAGKSPRRSRIRRRRFAVFFPALLAKFLSAGAMAQAATGATVAVVAFTGVGAAGALPDPVQDTFATVVATVTPLEAPTGEETTEEVVPEEVVDDVETADETADETTDETTDETAEVTDGAELVEAQAKAWALEGPAEDESFSAWVGQGSNADVKGWLRARGMTFGNVVSAWANGKGFTDEQLAALGAELEEPTEAPAETVVESDVTDTEEAETEVSVTEERGSRGNGHGGGKSNAGGNGRGHN